MVGEEEVTFNSVYNDLPDSKGELVALTAKDNFEQHPHLPAVQSLNDIGSPWRRCAPISSGRLIDGAKTPLGHRWSNLIG